MNFAFSKIDTKNVGENISKILSSKYSQKLFDHAKQSAADARKIVSKKTIQKTAETACDLIGNKIDDKVKRVSKNSEENKEGERFIYV